MKRYFAEFLGTATLVFVGCGAITIGGLGTALGSPQDISALALLPIAAAFGLTVAALAYGIGPISGCHINPAVSLGAWAAGRLPTSDLPGYILAQLVGGLFGAGLLYFVLTGKIGGYDLAVHGLGQNGWSGYAAPQAFVVEFIATFMFMVIILGATSREGMRLGNRICSLCHASRFHSRNGCIAQSGEVSWTGNRRGWPGIAGSLALSDRAAAGRARGGTDVQNVGAGSKVES